MNPNYEIHLDLQSWMTEFALLMTGFASAAGDQTAVKKYAQKSECFSKKLYDYLLDEQQNLFKDYLGL